MPENYPFSRLARFAHFDSTKSHEYHLISPSRRFTGIHSRRKFRERPLSSSHPRPLLSLLQDRRRILEKIAQNSFESASIQHCGASGIVSSVHRRMRARQSAVIADRCFDSIESRLGHSWKTCSVFWIIQLRRNFLSSFFLLSPFSFFLSLFLPLLFTSLFTLSFISGNCQARKFARN